MIREITWISSLCLAETLLSLNLQDLMVWSIACDGRAHRWRVIAGNASGFNLLQGWSAAWIFMNGTFSAPQIVHPYKVKL